MKKVIFYFALLGVGIFKSSIAQQLPNGNFDFWVVDSHNDTVPAGWGYDIDVADYFTHSSDAFSGKYSAAVCNWYNYAAGYLALGAPEDPNEDAGLNDDWSQYGIPFANRPLKLTGYYRYVDLINVDDSASVQILLTKKSNSNPSLDTIAYSSKLLGYAPNWTPFEIPLNYFSTENPDKIALLFTSRSYGQGYNQNVNPNVLYIDTIQLSYSTTGVSEIRDRINYLNIFPNPTMGEFSITSSLNEEQTFQVFDFSGKLMTTGIIQNEKTIIDGSNLSQGVYNVCIATNNERINKRLVVIR